MVTWLLVGHLYGAWFFPMMLKRIAGIERLVIEDEGVHFTAIESQNLQSGPPFDN